MKTKILTIIFLLLSFTGIAAAQNVSIQDASAAAGGTVVVPIMINNVTDAGSANINLIYNKDVINVISVTNSAFDVMFPNINNATGVTTIGAFQTASLGLNGNFKLADITLKAVGSTGQSSPLNLSITTLKTTGNVPIVVFLNNGTFTITGTPTPTPITASTSTSTSASSTNPNNAPTTAPATPSNDSLPIKGEDALTPAITPALTQTSVPQTMPLLATSPLETLVIIGLLGGIALLVLRKRL